MKTLAVLSALLFAGSAMAQTPFPTPEQILPPAPAITTHRSRPCAVWPKVSSRISGEAASSRRSQAMVSS